MWDEKEPNRYALVRQLDKEVVFMIRDVDSPASKAIYLDKHSLDVLMNYLDDVRAKLT